MSSTKSLVAASPSFAASMAGKASAMHTPVKSQSQSQSLDHFEGVASEGDDYRTPPSLKEPDAACSLRPQKGQPGVSDSARLEASLELSHHQNAAAIRAMFGSDTSIPREKRFIVNTVSPEEGHFLADYLDVPRENVLKINARKFRQGNSVAIAVDRAFEQFRRTHDIDGGSITFLGHMERGSGAGPEFGHLRSVDLHGMIRGIRPQQINMFSCSSETYSNELAQLFSADGYDIPRRTFVRDYEQVSQWPHKAGKPLKFFYAGEEIGSDVKAFSDREHRPAIEAFRTVESSSAGREFALSRVPDAHAGAGDGSEAYDEFFNRL